MKKEVEMSICQVLGVDELDLERVRDVTQRGIEREEELLKFVESPDLLGLPSRQKVKTDCLKRIVEAKDYLISYLELEIEMLKRKLSVWENETDVTEVEVERELAKGRK
jgi:hypothetical protein